MTEVKGYSDIAPEEAYELMQKSDMLILDVREPDEFASGHVHGAVNVPLGTILPGEILDEAPDLKRTVLLYCRTGHRSGIAGRIMAGTGYEDVRNFLGVEQWPYDLEK